MVGGAEVESRSFALTDMVRWGYNDLRNVSAGGASAKSVQGIPALHRAMAIRAMAVAQLRLKYWRGAGVEKVATNPWQAQLFAKDRYNDCQTRFDFWETVEESLGYRGNAYVWKLVDNGRVVAPYALHPDQVEPLGDDRYRVTVSKGYVDPLGRGPGRYTVDTNTIWHVRGHGDGGKDVAPSPIKLFSATFSAATARQAHELRMWRRGTALQGVVTFPAGVTKTQADEWQDDWNATYEGLDGDTTAVVGGGATFTPIGLSLEDAQFVDLAHLTIEDASRISGVPGNLLGVQVQRAVPNLEQDLSMWLRFGLGPELYRIECSLGADVHFSPAPGIWAAFDTDTFVRGDLLTEAQIMHGRIQDGTLTPDEGRAELGLKPHPGGLGAIPQVVPVGGGANPLDAPAKPAQPEQPAEPAK